VSSWIPLTVRDKAFFDSNPPERMKHDFAFISDDPRSMYLAMRDTRSPRAFCAYCRREASCMDGKTCPSCGAMELELEKNATP